MKTPKDLILPDVDEIKDNDWDSLREFLNDLISVIREDLHKNVYEDLKKLQS
ncbi:MAG: hypothetical protein AB7E08_05865 [Candidatus Omnitrophota bacterium]